MMQGYDGNDDKHQRRPGWTQWRAEGLRGSSGEKIQAFRIQTQTGKEKNRGRGVVPGLRLLGKGTRRREGGGTDRQTDRPAAEGRLLSRQEDLQ